MNIDLADLMVVEEIAKQSITSTSPSPTAPMKTTAHSAPRKTTAHSAPKTNSHLKNKN
jgi:hypothetical protein